MLSKNKAKYIQSLHLKKNRENEKLFLAEGRKIVRELLASDWRVVEIFASAEYIEQHLQLLRKKQIPFTEVSSEELKKISTLKQPDDALAICGMNAAGIEYPAIQESLSVYLDGLRDPGNLGTIIRVCDWFGIKNVFCSSDTAELFNPKTIQATMGSFLRVNVNYISLQSLLKEAERNKVKLPVYGAYMQGENLFTLKEFQPGILVIGNEANGISELNQKEISRRISIPSFGNSGAESLNAAIAGAIVIGEYRRING